MKKLLREKTGGLPVIFIGLVFFLMLITFMIMEMGAAYENYYDAGTILQRCCNNAVENNILDSYRADHILYLDIPGATADFSSYLNSDMPDKYTLHVSSITGSAVPPALIVTGTVTFSTLFHKYSFDDITFNFTVESSNFRAE